MQRAHEAPAAAREDLPHEVHVPPNTLTYRTRPKARVGHRNAACTATVPVAQGHREVRAIVHLRRQAQPPAARVARVDRRRVAHRATELTGPDAPAVQAAGGALRGAEESVVDRHILLQAGLRREAATLLVASGSNWDYIYLFYLVV